MLEIWQSYWSKPLNIIRDSVVSGIGWIHLYQWHHWLNRLQSLAASVRDKQVMTNVRCKQQTKLAMHSVKSLLPLFSCLVLCSTQEWCDWTFNWQRNPLMESWQPAPSTQGHTCFLGLQRNNEDFKVRCHNVCFLTAAQHNTDHGTSAATHAWAKVESAFRRWEPPSLPFVPVRYTSGAADGAVSWDKRQQRQSWRVYGWWLAGWTAGPMALRTMTSMQEKEQQTVSARHSLVTASCSFWVQLPCLGAGSLQYLLTDHILKMFHGNVKFHAERLHARYAFRVTVLFACTASLHTG